MLFHGAKQSKQWRACAETLTRVEQPPSYVTHLARLAALSAVFSGSRYSAANASVRDIT
jgi:hypothetical protein